MDTGKIVFIIIMGWTLIIHGGLTYLIVKKKEYSLISGFYNRPDDEKTYLKEHGYTVALGKLLTVTFYLLILAIILALLPIPYGFEVGLAAFLVVLLVGVVWVQRFEVPHKRMKMLWITGSVSGLTVVGVAVLVGIGMLENNVTIKVDTFKVSGMYGVEWPITEIESVELLDELPEVVVKSNGFAAVGQLKGHFRLEKPYGGGLLFVTGKTSPYLYIATEGDYLILNRKDRRETKQIYQTLKIKKSK